MQTQAEKAITKARANVFLDHGFFGYMLAKHTIHFTDSVPTLAVDGCKNIFVNPQFIEKYANDNKKIQWALCHEIMHPVLHHLTRRGARVPKMWNFAGDAIINDLLNESRVGSAIPNTVNRPGSSKKTTEQVYNELSREQEQKPSKPSKSGDPGQDGSPSNGGEPADPKESEFDNGLGDDILESPMTESERAQFEAEMRFDIAEAAAAARVRGQLSGALKAFVDAILESDIAWYDKLHEYMQGLQRHNYSWARPNRRFITQGHYLPSTGSIPTMGAIVIQLDISGSVSPKEATHFIAHVQRIMSECKPSKIHVLYTDARVCQHDEFDCADEVEINFFSAGGTDMTAGFKYCEKHGIEPDVFVCLTDGDTPQGSQQSFPVVWCVSRPDFKPVHGVYIPFSIKE